MAKKEEKKALGATEKAQSDMNTGMDDLRARNKEQIGINQGDMNYEHGDVYGTYKGFANTGGLTDEQKARLRGTTQPGSTGASGGSGGGGGGGSSSSKNSTGGMRDFYGDVGMIGRGTFDEAERAYKDMDQATAKRFAETGGLENADLDRWRGGGVYDEFGKTGGYSDVDKANIRSRAISPIGSFAAGERDEMARRRSVQGGYTPGFDASQRALKRDTARNIADTSLDAEIGIQENVNKGRQWGAEGMSRTEGEIETLRTQNQLEGSRQVAQIQQAVAGGMMSASQGRMMIDQTNQQTQLAIANGRTQREIAEMQAAAARGSASAAKELAMMQMNAQNERFLIEGEQAGKMFGAQGMERTYGFGANQYDTGMDRELNILNSQASNNIGLGGLRGGQADMIGGPWDAVQQGIGMAAGAAGAFSGMGGMGMGSQAGPFQGSQQFWS